MNMIRKTPTASDSSQNIDGADTQSKNKKRSFDESIASSAGGDATSLSKDAHEDLSSTSTATTRISSPTNKGKDSREEKRMKVNRIRAKEIRKRKKKLEEDMQKQIIQLTLENNKLRTQVKMQQTEISLLRNTKTPYQLDLQPTFAAQQHQHQHQHQLQQFLVPDSYRESLLISQHGRLQPNSPTGAISGTGGLLYQQNGNQNVYEYNSAAAATAATGGLLPLRQQQVADPVGSDLSSLFCTTGAGIPPSFYNQLSTIGMGIGIEGNDADANEQHLASLLANSTSSVKHKILAKLQNEDKEARNHQNYLLSEKLQDPSAIADEM